MKKSWKGRGQSGPVRHVASVETRIKLCQQTAHSRLIQGRSLGAEAESHQQVCGWVVRRSRACVCMCGSGGLGIALMALWVVMLWCDDRGGCAYVFCTDGRVEIFACLIRVRGDEMRKGRGGVSVLVSADHIS